MTAGRLSVASFDALADARAQLDVAITQALVRVSRSEQHEAEARKLNEALRAAIEAVRMAARRKPVTVITATNDSD